MLRKLSRKRNAWCLVALLVVLVAAVGCSDAEKDAEQQGAARDARLSELQDAKAELEEMRAELAELKAEMEAAAEAEAEGDGDGAAEDGEEGEPTEDPAARIRQLENQIASRSEQFYGDLVAFINENPLLEGEEPNERQKAAFRMKSEEDIQIAREYVEKGGDYRRAITILEDSLAVDPDNELLLEALADVESKRFMTEERLAQVEKGMNRDEVRNVLGIPYHANIRSYEEDGVVAWFYPVDEQGSAAAVWFRQRGDDYQVYETNFEERDASGEDGGEDT